MRSLGPAPLCSGILLLAPAAASGQGYLTAFVGGNFGGEFEVGYTPNFYGKGTVFDSSGVLTMMGNLVLGVPAGSVRPYAVLGLGLIRRTIDYAQGQGQPGVAVTDSRVAYDLGGSVSNSEPINGLGDSPVRHPFASGFQCSPFSSMVRRA